jgi:hypothetical protein
LLRELAGVGEGEGLGVLTCGRVSIEVSQWNQFMVNWVLTLCRLWLLLLGLLGSPMGLVCLPVHLEAPCSGAPNVRCTRSLVATASLTQRQQLQNFLGGRLSIRKWVDTVGFCSGGGVSAREATLMAWDDSRTAFGHVRTPEESRRVAALPWSRLPHHLVYCL